jgi:hypothetical protein
VFVIERRNLWIVHQKAALKNADVIRLAHGEIPVLRSAGARVYDLIGGHSRMESHIRGNLRRTATSIEPKGSLRLQLPEDDKDLFLYITDGAGKFKNEDGTQTPGRYNVILARADVEATLISAGVDESLHYLSFYLPKFLD